MSKYESRLNNAEIQKFLVGRPVYVFDPATRSQIATVEYQMDGVCHAQFVDGRTDEGTWGTSGDTYWTRYKTIRDGTRNVFFLQWLSSDLAQAYHDDGRRAYLQSGSVDAGDVRK